MNTTVKTELTELIARKGWNQSQVARAIGKSPAVINQYLLDKYQGNNAQLDEDIQSFLNREYEKEKTQKIVSIFVPTYTARRALEVIKMAHHDGDINVIYGDAGMGKTMVMRQYAAENRDAILIEADPGYTARVVLEELCGKLGLNKRGNMHELSVACINALKDSGRPLLVDEAENLPYRALETIRRIHDKTGIGVVLAGMPRLIINLKGKRGEYKQLYSRVGFALSLGDALPRDDINDIAASVLPETEDSNINDALFTASKGNARRLFKLLRGVHRRSVITGDPIDAVAVRKMSEMLIS
ncbi:AAA family ATPase [Budviciaceae bacterium CWB-B4]|uniref:AAA family ATPase n=1 Tax=Limnobaculum xujianqingii TaxID=2738837 RepID=A0A9D7FS30_9GAMM|nr:AAA family ATPase [Limnobaculum xujianqingii]MBK5072539.1 AAA family ATPase [Limnobaculum xujianqingii]MBK5175848.1 AAA family ATPase [Limnobaculum xujianqingii]